jgi:hypothetical protein
MYLRKDGHNWSKLVGIETDFSIEVQLTRLGNARGAVPRGFQVMNREMKHYYGAF